MLTLAQTLLQQCSNPMQTRNKRLALATLAVLGGLLMLGGARTMTRPPLKYFTASEFGLWWPLMSKDLLLKLDAFREAWGAPVALSPAQGGIGREDNSNSQHNVSLWREVRAVDVMPEGMNTAADRSRAVAIAKAVGFTGIGIYPDWNPRAGLHLDVRKPETPGYVATWAGLKDHNGQQYYAAIEQGLA